MKSILIKTIAIMLLSFQLQAQLNENFDDGDFTNNPAWSGDATSFQILNGQLNSTNTTANAVFYLSTPSAIANNAQWEIFMNLKFLTSSANYVDVFLISDKADVNNNSSGFFIRIGGTNDEICLYRNDAGSITKIIDGVDARSQISSDNYIKIKVIRDAANLFTLSDSVAGASPVELTEGTITDAAYITSSFFGISVKQSTSTFFGKHYFDNIYAGNIITDTVAPTLSSISVINQNAVDVLFSEPIEITTSENETNYSVNNLIGNPASAIRDISNPALIHLTFSNAFTDALLNTLTVNNLTDVSGNIVVANTTGSFTWFAPVTVLPQDVVFSEIMADPAVGTGLPPQEYVEIFNRSNKSFDLINWSFKDATGSNQLFPSVTLLPNEYAVICDNAYATSFVPYGKVIAVSSMPALNNDGDLLTLFDALNNVIDEVNYDKTFYHDATKENGGWSIEKVDLNFPCISNDNWKASVATNGGTPATVNSVNGLLIDSVKPFIAKVLVVDATTITIYFSEIMNTATLTNLNAYNISNGIGNPVNVSVLSGNQSVQLTLANALQPQIVYTLTVVNTLTDCSGNAIEINNNIEFGIPETPLISDLLINEILFNPFAGGYDFVELYNNSNKIIDLSKLTITEVDATTGLGGTAVPLASDGYYLLPHAYVAITEWRDDIIARYTTSNAIAVLNVNGFPDFNNDENICVITNEQQIEVDRFRYSETFHYPLLNDVEGYSLERISFTRITQDSTNWHSAAESLKATPAYKNSQSESTAATDNTVTIEPETFSPDNDGYNDVLNVHLQLNEPGLTANVQVYDNRGQLVQYLLRNQLLGTDETKISWDGINLDNEKAHIGIYILYTEIFNQSGDVKKYKNAFVLAGKLK